MPVIGLVQVGFQSIADRYTYVPLIGIFIIIAWGMPELFGRIPEGRNLLSAAAFIVLGVCLAATWIQVHYWRNSITLFSHTAEVTSNNIRAEYNLAEALGRAGQTDQAVAHYLPGAVEMHNQTASKHITTTNLKLIIILA